VLAAERGIFRIVPYERHLPPVQPSLNNQQTNTLPAAVLHIQKTVLMPAVSQSPGYTGLSKAQKKAPGDCW